jgi:hypothetical protein
LFSWQGKAQEISEWTKPAIPRIAYRCDVELGALLSPGSSSQTTLVNNAASSFTFQMFHAVRFAHFLRVGGTIGLDAYTGVNVAPVGGGIRGDFLREGITPFYVLETGFGFAWLNKIDTQNQLTGLSQQESLGGQYFTVGLGLKVPLVDNKALLVVIGFKDQQVVIRTTQRIPNAANLVLTDRLRLERWFVRVGFQF